MDQIALYKPDGKKLEKGLDGFLRLNDGTTPQVGEGLKLMNGVLESSNVNTAAALVDMISYQRKFDLQIKMMQTAKQLETSSDKLLSIR
ncbi:MAG: hypothetical protein IE936_13120 [Moraxella osloensis]|nr:hypothetical protein [Moraxella osloensis]